MKLINLEGRYQDEIYKIDRGMRVRFRFFSWIGIRYLYFYFDINIICGLDEEKGFVVVKSYTYKLRED